MAMGTSYHLRGASVCGNRQLLPMELANTRVLETFRNQLLDPRVLERALAKLEARHTRPADNSGVWAMESEQARIRAELGRLTSALGAGGHLSSILAAVQEREGRLHAITAGLYRARAEASALDVSLKVVMPQVRRRLHEWGTVLTEEIDAGASDAPVPVARAARVQPRRRAAGLRVRGRRGSVDGVPRVVSVPKA